MGGARVKEELRTFVHRWLAVEDGSDPEDGRFTFTVGKSRKAARKACAATYWTEDGGARDRDQVIREVARKVSQIQDEDEGHLWISAHLQGETQPEEWIRVDGSTGPSALTEDWTEVGSNLGWRAMTEVITQLLGGLGDSHAQLLHNTRELGRVQADLMQTELVLRLAADADGSQRMQDALESLGPHLAPLIPKILDSLMGNPARASGPEPTAPAERVPHLVDRVYGDLAELGLLATSDPEIFTAEIRAKVDQILSMVDGWRQAAGAPNGTP